MPALFQQLKIPVDIQLNQLYILLMQTDASLQLLGYSDGGSRDKNKSAGYGVVLIDQHGKKTTIREFIGPGTNNDAEYRGLIAALEMAIEMGAEVLQMRMDSELVVRQINGVYSVSEKLLPYYQKATRLSRMIPAFILEHVYREQNAEADSLVDQAIKSKTFGKVVA